MINIKSFGVKRGGNGSTTSSSSSGGFANTTINTTVKSVKIWGQEHDHTRDIDGDILTSGNVEAQGNITANDIITSGNVEAQGNIIANDITANGAIDGNSIHSNTTIEAGGAISGDDGIFTGDINAIDAHFENLYVNGDIEADNVETNELTATDGTITNLVADYLTVTKQAHFCELIIDKIKSNSGQIIVSAANAKIDKVDVMTDAYKCYWRKKDEETNKAIANEFIINDQVICQTFNVQEGTNYNASNKYYWRLVTDSGTETTTIDGETQECNYIVLSDTVKDGTSIPEAGDEIVQLGYRGTDDAARQSAIIISSYTSPDPNVQAPSIVQYTGVNSFSLGNRIMNQMSANGNVFTGDFKVITGNTITDVKDLVSGTLPTIVTNSDAAFIMANSSSQITSLSECQNLPTNIKLYEGDTLIDYRAWTSNSYIKNGSQSSVGLKSNMVVQQQGLGISAVASDRAGGCNVTWRIISAQSLDGTTQPVTVNTHNCTIYIEYTDGRDTKSITKNVPLNVITNGATITGADAEFDKMKVNECDLTALVDGRLRISANVEVQHIKGSTISTLDTLTDYACYIQFRAGGSRYNLTRNAANFTTLTHIDNWQNGNPFTSATLTLTKNGDVVDTFVAAVKFNAGSMFQVRDDAITASVQQSQTYTDNEITTVNADIAQLELTAQGLNTRVTNIEGEYVTSSELSQTATNIQLNVYNELNESTGIDVSNGEITLTAGKTNFVNERGNQIASFTGNGLQSNVVECLDDNGNMRVRLDKDGLKMYYPNGQVMKEEVFVYGESGVVGAATCYYNNDGTLRWMINTEGELDMGEIDASWNSQASYYLNDVADIVTGAAQHKNLRYEWSNTASIVTNCTIAQYSTASTGSAYNGMWTMADVTSNPPASTVPRLNGWIMSPLTATQSGSNYSRTFYYYSGGFRGTTGITFKPTTTTTKVLAGVSYIRFTFNLTTNAVTSYTAFDANGTIVTPSDPTPTPVQ